MHNAQRRSRSSVGRGQHAVLLVKVRLARYKQEGCCNVAQKPELAEAVEKEVIGYEGYEEFSLGYLFLPLDQRRSLIRKVDIIGCHSNVIS